MTELDIDWDKVSWVKPTNNEIIRYSKCLPFSEFGVATYQHANWAFKEAGMIAVCVPGSSDSLAYGTLVAVCQKCVKDNDLKESIPTLRTEKKKRGWFW